MPWAYCILKKRNQFRAKCAIDGVPQRQNASPKNCFGCAHNLAKSDNITGILLSIVNDIKVINTQNIPDSFFNESYRTVKNALILLKDLNADQSIIDKISAALSANTRGVIFSA